MEVLEGQNSKRGGQRRRVFALVITILSAAIVTPLAVSAMSDNSTSQLESENSSTPLEAVHTMQSSEALSEEPAVPAGSNGSTNHTSVTVNGQPVAVPKNGTYNKTTTDNSGRTEVTVNSSHSSSDTSGSTSSSSVNINISNKTSSSSPD